MQIDTHGLVAVILAIGVVTAVVILALETVWHPGPISESEATVLSTIVGAVIGAVAAYLGVRSTDRGRGDRDGGGAK